MMFDNLIGQSVGGAPDSTVDAKTAIIDELRAAGASDNLIRGVMANVRDESGFNPGLRHPDQPRWSGEPHYAHGLYQEGAQEWINYDNWLKQNYPGQSWTDPTLQTRFLGQNLKQNYPSLWQTMNSVRTPEEAAQAFVSGYLKPREDLRRQRVAAYGRGVPDLDQYVAGGGTPANMSQDDQLVRSIGSGNADSALAPSPEDRLSSAMMSGKGTSMPPVLQIQQQKAQDLSNLMDEGPSYKQLADALLAAGQSMGRTARTPWEALGSIAQIASGTYQGEQAKAAEKDYVARLGAALQGTGATPEAVRAAMLANPETRTAAMQSILKAHNPEYGKTPIYGVDAQGNPALVQTSDAGGPAKAVALPEGFKLSTGVEKIDLGDRFALQDKRSGAIVGYVPKNVAAKESLEAQGQAQGKAAADLPRIMDNTQTALDTIQAIRTHPGKSWGTGATYYLSGLPGTQSREFNNLVAQAKGQTFLQAFNSLRGGGQITEAEGSKATQALARLDQAQSEGAFDKALFDLEEILNRGAQRAKSSATATPVLPSGGASATSTVNNPFLNSPASPTPTPSPGATSATSNANDPLAAAKAAISSGAPRDAVIERLKQNGIDPSGL